MKNWFRRASGRPASAGAGISAARLNVPSDEVIKPWTTMVVARGDDEPAKVSYQVVRRARAVHIRILGVGIAMAVKLDSRLVLCDPVYEAAVARSVAGSMALEE